MHNTPPLTPLPLAVGLSTPGIKLRRGPFSPQGIAPPPNAAVEAQELAYLRYLNSHRDPQSVFFTEYLADKGDRELWFHFAKQYRQRRGFLAGWLGTALMGIAMGVSAKHAHDAKRHYGRLRPYMIDGTLVPIGKKESSRSYPSGHTTSSYAAATVLGMLWPSRAAEFNWWARQVAISRMHGAMHFPSDVAMGAHIGRTAGLRTASILF